MILISKGSIVDHGTYEEVFQRNPVFHGILKTSTETTVSQSLQFLVKNRNFGQKKLVENRNLVKNRNLSKNRNFIRKSEFYWKIEILFGNRNFIRKSKGNHKK